MAMEWQGVCDPSNLAGQLMASGHDPSNLAGAGPPGKIIMARGVQVKKQTYMLYLMNL